MAYQKDLQSLFHDYEKHIGRPGLPRDAIDWGVANGRVAEPKLDPRAKLVSDLKDALRTEKRVDANGREYHVNAAITFTDDGGVQTALWGGVDSPSTPDAFLVEHVGQRRKAIGYDCKQLKDTVDHITSKRPSLRKHYEQTPLIFDFTDDL